jgi:hypothetical protein
MNEQQQQQQWEPFYPQTNKDLHGKLVEKDTIEGKLQSWSKIRLDRRGRVQISNEVHVPFMADIVAWSRASFK